MNRKKDVIYSSTNEALLKLIVLILTFGISIFASFLDDKSCYVTILVQACNNMYDFYKCADNRLYKPVVKRHAITIILFASFGIILSIAAITESYPVFQLSKMKFFVIMLVSVPLYVVFYDYKVNEKKENG